MVSVCFSENCGGPILVLGGGDVIVLLVFSALKALLCFAIGIQPIVSHW